MIEFETKDVEMPLLDLGKVEKWLGEVAASHGRRIGNLNYLFCDDDEIIRVNREFLHHDYFSNAEELGVAYERELLRVIVHGLLHLCGIDDKGPGEREIMEANEDAALEIWETIE